VLKREPTFSAGAFMLQTYHFWLRSSEGNPEVMNSFEWGKGLPAATKSEVYEGRNVSQPKKRNIFLTLDRDAAAWVTFNKRTSGQYGYFHWGDGAYQIIGFRMRTRFQMVTREANRP
jgi:hypothetical protein